MPLKVLYEDNHLIAVFKPAGVLAQGDRSGSLSLMDEVKTYLKKKYNKPGNVFLGLLHRLDRPVSGIILFAKTSKGASRLSEQFREHSLQKIYHALVAGKPPANRATLVDFLLKDEVINRTDVYARPVAGSQRAELDYELVKSDGKHSLLKIILKTGRSHQIRAQLAAAGLPIIGDKKYGSKEPYAGEGIALCATTLVFVSATGEETRTIAIAPPFDV